MRGFLAGIALTAPVTALIMLFYLDSRNTVELRAERAYQEQRAERRAFDAQFTAAWRQLSGSDPPAPAAARLEPDPAQLEALERRVGERLQRGEQDADHLRRAIATPAAPALEPPLPPPEQP